MLNTANFHWHSILGPWQCFYVHVWGRIKIYKYYHSPSVMKNRSFNKSVIRQGRRTLWNEQTAKRVTGNFCTPCTLVSHTCNDDLFFYKIFIYKTQHSHSLARGCPVRGSHSLMGCWLSLLPEARRLLEGCQSTHLTSAPWPEERRPFKNHITRQWLNLPESSVFLISWSPFVLVYEKEM